MIDINLIPQNLRKRKSKSILPGGFKIPLEIVIGLGGGLFALLIIVHIFLAFLNYAKVSKYKKLQKQWEEISPAKQNVDGVINNMRQLQQKYKDIESISESSKVLWSKKLNILSDKLPKEIWLRKISLGKDTLLIEGSSISRQNQEMNTVLNFTSDLRNQEGFLDNLSDLELGSIFRRNIKNVEIADFLITIRLKKE